ncbi:MAG: hypothetical protein CFE21_15370 [Bacteroidetes bacterium B1(2017)]|nr:MAG: hypothetical protein CFE21_15370 [Bacteroidetes bacterium B1(2017)]
MYNRSFLNKHLVLLGLLLSMLFIAIAMLVYPGGSIIDKQASGYSFSQNYISNLLEYTALNGRDNTARPFGVIGVVLMGVFTGLAFVRFANKVDIKKYSLPIMYFGFCLMLFSSLISIPAQHDLMITISSVFTLLVVFYSSILLLKTKLMPLKILSISMLLFLYAMVYMYFTQTGLVYLPILQKWMHILQFIWLLNLEYATKQSDFEQVK